MVRTWGGVVIKDSGGRLVTERGAVLKVEEGYFRELLNRDKATESCSYHVLWRGKWSWWKSRRRMCGQH